MFETVTLITGGTGFVGQKLVQNLDHSGIGIRLISRKAHPNYESVVCDLKDAHVPESAMLGVDTVFHLAGFAHDLRDANQVSQLYRTVNVDATVRLAELSVHYGVKRFIFVSSVKAGGSAITGRCMTEEDQAKNKPSLELRETPDWDYKVRLKLEKEALGFYLSGHPLEPYQKEFKYFKPRVTATTLEEANPREFVQKKVHILKLLL